MKIAVLHPSYEGSSSPFKDLEPDCDPARYLPEHDCTNFRIGKATAVRDLAAIARQGFELAINLCDGAWDEDRAGIEVVQALERIGMAFTGAGSAFYDPSRESMKMACHSVGVAFPAYWIVRGRPNVADAVEAAVEDAAAALRFPLLVKHPHGYSSVGLTPGSRVSNAEELRGQAETIVAEHGSALVEEFIEGREFTVLVAEARDARELAWALAPVEFLFPEGESFKHFDLKWKDYDRMTTRVVTEEPLAGRLREAAALTFAALNGTGYGRCDIRMDAAGNIFVLEINPYCAVFYPEGAYGSADFILAAEPAGHRGFLEHLIRCALRRRERERRAWELRYRRKQGFGMVAARHLRAGELVERYEERAHMLVSRHHVERRWAGLKRRWFEHYAWPITGELHVMWSGNPEDWRPINHACNPNTWLDGLDLVARRDICPGEELTIEYATFCGPGMAAFECHCGDANCRQVILGSDHLLPRIREVYGDHVSDFVRAAWHNTGPEWRPPFELVRNSFGLGLVARRAWRAEEAISLLRWDPKSSTPTRWTVECGDGQHAQPLPFELRYINHSCEPSVQFDLEAGVLRALRDIEPGDELRYFYPSTEWSLAEVFECRCGSAECLGSITGAAGMPLQVLKRHRLSPWIWQCLGNASAMHLPACGGELAKSY